MSNVIQFSKYKKIRDKEIVNQEISEYMEEQHQWLKENVPEYSVDIFDCTEWDTP